jgi:hypothetical protein
MAGEKLPELNKDAEHFINLVRIQINALPTSPSPPIDPYVPRRSHGQPVRPKYDTLYHPDGRVDFGSEYDVRRLLISGHELVYASKPQNTSRTTFLVNSFAVGGGLGQRVSFRGDKDGVRKRHEAPPWDVTDGPGFHRLLEIGEVALLEEVITKPNIDTISRLVTLQGIDVELLESDKKDREARDARLQAGLEAIDEAQRRAWEHL